MIRYDRCILSVTDNVRSADLFLRITEYVIQPLFILCCFAASICFTPPINLFCYCDTVIFFFCQQIGIYPSTGLTILPSAGIIAAPSPKTFSENTESGTSLNGTAFPVNGARITCGIFLPLFSFPTKPPHVFLLHLFMQSFALIIVKFCIIFNLYFDYGT